jgi:DOPA 4,5-dioxygenase
MSDAPSTQAQAAVESVDGWHAHIYFEPATRERALRVRERIADELGLQVGRVHDRLVGPHTAPMFQVLIPNDALAAAATWLALNRDGLVVLLHPETGDHRADHTDHALWMGAVLDVNVGAFG